MTRRVRRLNLSRGTTARKETVMNTFLASRIVDYAIATGLIAIVALNVLWVWPIAAFRVL